MTSIWVLLIHLSEPPVIGLFFITIVVAGIGTDPVETSPKVRLSGIILRREGNLNFRTSSLMYSHDVVI